MSKNSRRRKKAATKAPIVTPTEIVQELPPTPPVEVEEAPVEVPPPPVPPLAPQGPVSLVKVHMLQTGDPCDDELFTLKESMFPNHVRFCDLYLQGYKGTEAALKSGASEASAKNWSYRTLRRDDVRKYIHLQRQLANRTSHVTLATVRDRLYRQWCDPSLSNTQRNSARDQLIRVMLAGVQEAPEFLQASEPGQYGAQKGLSKAIQDQIKIQLLGVVPEEDQGPSA